MRGREKNRKLEEQQRERKKKERDKGERDINKERVGEIKMREGAKISFYSPTYNQCSRKPPLISQM